MGYNPPSTNNADFPVGNVSWFDAIAYCNALSRTVGLEEAYVIDGGNSVRWKGLDALGYRLPTEAEWEYAGRAGTTGDLYNNVNPTSAVNAVAWHEGNSGDTFHPVGQKLPNSWGFFDMFGNIFEWCWDWYEENPEGASLDPVGPVDGEQRVQRGGYYKSLSFSLSNRSHWEPSNAAFLCGFRPVRSCPFPLPYRQIAAKLCKGFDP